jgi:molecular chaperone DnaJ
LFKRQDNNILVEIPVTMVQAALGAEIDVPTLNGPVKMKVPAGTQSGRVFRLKGKGLPYVHDSGRGDQLVKIVVETPVGISPRKRQLLEEFARLSNHSVSPQVKAFIDRIKDIFRR